VPQSDLAVPVRYRRHQALQLARLWRRWAEMATWRPLARYRRARRDAAISRSGLPEDRETPTGWQRLTCLEGVDLITRRRGRARRINRPGHEQAQPAGVSCRCLGATKAAGADQPAFVGAGGESYGWSCILACRDDGIYRMRRGQRQGRLREIERRAGRAKKAD